MPAVPALIMAGGAIGGGLLSRSAANSAAEAAAKRTPTEQGLIDTQARTATDLMNSTTPAIKSTLGYYQTLLSGNRAARMNAVSPEAQDTSAAYAGADKSLRSGYLRGGERDQALAENERAKAGQIARLVTGTRPGAAAGIAGLAPGVLGTGGSLGLGTLGNETQNRQLANQIGLGVGQGTGSAIGSLIASLVNVYGGAGRSGGGGSFSPTGPYAGGYQFGSDLAAPPPGLGEA